MEKCSSCIHWPLSTGKDLNNYFDIALFQISEATLQYVKPYTKIFAYKCIVPMLILCKCFVSHQHIKNCKTPIRFTKKLISLQWRHDERDGVPSHRRLAFLRNRLLRRRSKKTSKLRVTGFCEGNPQVAGGFPSQRASNAENVSIWWRHHVDLGKFGWPQT